MSWHVCYGITCIVGVIAIGIYLYFEPEARRRRRHGAVLNEPARECQRNYVP